MFRIIILGISLGLVPPILARETTSVTAGLTIPGDVVTIAMEL